MEQKRTGELIRMTTKVQKWGNSLAVRIPVYVADKLGLKQGSHVDMEVNNNEMKIKPTKRIPTLEELVAQITPENRHDEIDFGVEGDELI